MSLNHSIAQFKKPIGKGSERVAYYSKKYNVVIKLLRDKCPDNGNQNTAEIALYNRMTPEERLATPMLGYGEYKGLPYIIMERVQTIYDLGANVPNCIMGRYSLTAEEIPEKYRPLFKIMKKYGIRDAHKDNLGETKDGRFVILDFGIARRFGG